MSPFSWPVLLGTLLVGSPALWAAQVSGTLSPDVAIIRLLVCMGAVWAGCSLVAGLAAGTVAANEAAAAAELALARAEAAAESAAESELADTAPEAA